MKAFAIFCLLVALLGLAAAGRIDAQLIASDPMVPDSAFEARPELSEELLGNLAGPYTAEWRGDKLYVTWQMFQATSGDYPINAIYNVSQGTLNEISRVLAPLNLGVANGKVAEDGSYIVNSQSTPSPLFPPSIPKPLRDQEFKLRFHDVHFGQINQTPLLVDFDQFVTPGKFLYKATAAYNNVIEAFDDCIVLCYSETDVEVPNLFARIAATNQTIVDAVGPGVVPDELVLAITFATSTNYITDTYFDVIHVGANKELTSVLKFALPKSTVPPTPVAPGFPFAYQHNTYSQNAIVHKMNQDSGKQWTLTASVNTFSVGAPVGPESRIATWKIDLEAATAALTGITFLPNFIEDHTVDVRNDVIYTCGHRTVDDTNNGAISSRTAAPAHNTPSIDREAEIQSFRIRNDGSHQYVRGYNYDASCSQIDVTENGREIAFSLAPFLRVGIFDLPPETSPLGLTSSIPGDSQVMVARTNSGRIDDITPIGGVGSLAFALKFNSHANYLFSGQIPRYEKAAAGGTIIARDGGVLYELE